jgi:hypothetical protein
MGDAGLFIGRLSRNSLFVSILLRNSLLALGLGFVRASSNDLIAAAIGIICSLILGELIPGLRE